MSSQAADFLVLSKFDLTGKSVLITGGAGLLGFQHAAAILEVGGRVVLTDISASELEKSTVRLREIFSDDLIVSMFMDVTDFNSVDTVFCSLQDRDIQVSVLVNNAMIDAKVTTSGKVTQSTRLEALDIVDWNRQLAVGLTGAAICTQIFGRAMAENGSGVILNIGSDLSVIAPDQRIYLRDGVSREDQSVKPLAYSVVKAGLAGLTRYVAAYWGHRGVRCNMISPGPVLVDQSPEFLDRLMHHIPLGRLAQVDEYQSAIQFMCSDASSYLNGHNLVMDGGRTIW